MGLLDPPSLSPSTAAVTYAPLVTALAPNRAARAVAADVSWFPPVGQANARNLMPTSRNRLGLIVRNSSTTQVLKVALGTLDADSTAPASGAYVDVPVGSEYVTGDARPVWAYFPTTSEAVLVRTRTVA
ncbi:hypothetical protein [Rhodococcoides fascians]|uniref:hypothetical protein n=1 Tax=Rhodococcoides fascians TaxID=1828 RepID=UPI0024BAB189|nr:hypothetical protein [Rhodococcus fascians]MDJ0467287.1 hypothetical protein [Rhodococcus fascians]